MERRTTHPVFPRLLNKPLALIPPAIHSTVLAMLLNQVFRKARRDGDLDFFEGRVLDIEVRDAGLRYRLTMRNRRLYRARSGRTADVGFSGTVYDFMVLAAREADPDTLFFQRRLRLSGDTELGLYLKNFLSALDPEKISKIIFDLSPKVLSVYEKILGP